jgi:mono/diheme cytochrome c family protein
MRVVEKLIFTVWLLFGANSFAKAEIIPNEARGGLLYSTHCSACHNSTIHWREQKLATDWKSLKAQVRLWQGYTKLRWSEQDIMDVTAYLNMHYYNFISTEQKALTLSKNSN